MSSVVSTEPTTSATSASESKRALKRRLKAERAAAQATTVEDALKAVKEIEPIPEELQLEDFQIPEEDSTASPYAEAVQKRIRVLRKKQERIEKYEQQKAEGKVALNADQIALINSKEAVTTALAELSSLIEPFTTFTKESQSTNRDRLRSVQRAVANAVVKAREQGREEGRKDVLVLVRFLRTASYVRVNPRGSDAENDASEAVLGMVYEGNEESCEIVRKIASESTEAIPESSVTYAQLKAIVDEVMAPEPEPESEVAEQLTEAQGQQMTPEEDHKAETGSVCSESSSIAHEAVVPSGGISFLNESEIGAHQPHEDSVSVPSYAEGALAEALDANVTEPTAPSMSFEDDTGAQQHVAATATLSSADGGANLAAEGWENPTTNSTPPVPTAVEVTPAAPQEQQQQQQQNGGQKNRGGRRNGGQTGNRGPRQQNGEGQGERQNQNPGQGRGQGRGRGGRGGQSQGQGQGPRGGRGGQGQQGGNRPPRQQQPQQQQQ
ncbi:hypothetical protein SAICODRAFT_25242 [Saitoella complicata NRRL Y-17804]|uniref:uncharacterized protein n=1 Tax=Saitoella complicata (strain BCRC 22490 / CBS 7301 / JCM 7358 / NBRC 10748 / NRRL Y-17804) TaxID=698492 RepID=UPI000868287B|nr:uncharacterized protein SAICODRAFT_25242 [Saitoella complicata NRRL Y-17804]ODQ53146.1 hypothetical protein SAICODRAFT_25242 [Saitoella complicata NRRL Y-17804]